MRVLGLESGPERESRIGFGEVGRRRFFNEEVLARLRLLPSELETALFELAGHGLAACDGFAGLRALCARAGRRRTREGQAPQMVAAGRWSLTGIPRASAALSLAGIVTPGKLLPSWGFNT